MGYALEPATCPTTSVAPEPQRKGIPARYDCGDAEGSAEQGPGRSTVKESIKISSGRPTMNRLPRTVVELTDTLTLAARYELAGPTSALRRRLLEKDYDQLFVQFRDVIAGLLRDADLVAAESELKY